MISPPSDLLTADGTTHRLPPNALGVPVVKQRTDFSCGPAAALSILRLWRSDRFAGLEETELHGPLETTSAQGTEPEPIAEYLRANASLRAEYRHGDVTVAQLMEAVDRREPPIVDLQAWRDRDHPWRETWDAGHYVVLVGYDDERLFVMDPSVLTPGPHAFLPLVELDERWHDLAGPHDVPVERMVIFVGGGNSDRGVAWERVAGVATRLR